MSKAVEAIIRADDKIMDRLEADNARLRAALETCADVIRGFDGGDPKQCSGWRHDELLEAWIKARDALENRPTATRHTKGGPTEGDPNRPYCKPDQSCCDFCCGN